MSFRNGRTLIFGLGIPIVVDAVKSAKHDSKVTFTRHPVESGRLNTDHGQIQPDEIEKNIVISDTPTADGTTVFQGRGLLIYAQLKLWLKLKSPILIVDSFGSHVNMRLELVSANKGERTGKSMDVSLKFVELLDTDLDLTARTLLGLVDNTVVHSATESIPLGVI